MASGKQISGSFERLANSITRFSGSSQVFLAALALVLVWAFTGPLMKFSDTWQLIINTGTSIVTFLMVFIIQQSQNKETRAIQIKLNELISATKNARNGLMGIENLSEPELEELQQYYFKMTELVKGRKTQLEPSAPVPME
jgi:low affinity Fe/Cu permease